MAVPRSLSPVLVFAVSWVLLLALIQAPPLHEDTARDLLLARDCVNAGYCAMAGPTTSFSGLTQGALWIHLLEACHFLGFGLRGARDAVLLLHASSAALIYAATRNPEGRYVAFSAWALYLAAMTYVIGLPILWNPSLLPLPLVIFYLALASLAVIPASKHDANGVATSVAAGVSLGLSADAHVLCLALAFPLLVAVVAFSRRPSLAMPLTLLSIGLPIFLSSRGALLANLPLLSRAWAPSGAFFALALLAGFLLRRRASALAPAHRTRATLALSCVYACALLGALRALTGHAVTERYFAYAVPPVALLLGDLLVGRTSDADSPRGKRVAALSAFVLALVLVGPRVWARERALTMFDAERLAGCLLAEGYDYPGVYRHLRGVDAHLLLASLAPYFPPPGGSQTGPSRISDDVLVLKVKRSDLPHPTPANWSVEDLRDCPDSTVAVLRRAPSWIDRRTLEWCDDSATLHCEAVDLEARDPDRGVRGSVVQRAYPALVSPLKRFGVQKSPNEGPFHASVRLKIHASGRPHVFTIVDRNVGWRITRVSGLHVDEELPAQEVTLEGEGEGAIVLGLDVPVGGAQRFRRALPDFSETSKDEVELRNLLTRARLL